MSRRSITRKSSPAATVRKTSEPPGGLKYIDDFISPDQERELVANIETLEFHEVRMHGVVARRTVIHFGWDYDYEGWKVRPTTQPPDWLAALRDRCAAAADVAPQKLEQFLIARYPAGASIGWHRDAPMFGQPVVGVSLLSSCRMRFRKSDVTFTQVLEPRSLYMLSGAARTSWQHHIPPTRSLRYSITMRTLRSS